jgi:hypothetical protein
MLFFVVLLLLLKCFVTCYCYVVFYSSVTVKAQSYCFVFIIIFTHCVTVKAQVTIRFCFQSVLQSALLTSYHPVWEKRLLVGRWHPTSGIPYGTSAVFSLTAEDVNPLGIVNPLGMKGVQSINLLCCQSTCKAWQFQSVWSSTPPEKGTAFGAKYWGSYRVF